MTMRKYPTFTTCRTLEESAPNMFTNDCPSTETQMPTPRRVPPPSWEEKDNVSARAGDL